MKFGIDVSKWQGDFDFAKARKEGVEFAILKAGGGDSVLYKDGKFERNYAEAKKNGLVVGAYFFGYATTPDMAIAEADYFVSLLQNKQFELPMWYDVEAKRQLDLSVSALEKIINAFINRVESKGYRCGVYGSAINGFRDNFPNIQAIKWVASYGKSKPSTSNMVMWQFGGEVNYLRSNKIAGVTCDQNYLYDESLIQNKPITPETKPETKPIVDVSKYPLLYKKTPMMKGEYVTLLQKRLKELGYDCKGIDGNFGANTDKAVRNYQAAHKDKDGKKLSVDGKVGQKTWYALMNL